MKRAFPKDLVQDLAQQLDLKEMAAYKTDTPVPELNERLIRAALMEFSLEIKEDNGTILSFNYEGLKIELRTGNLPVIRISTKWEPFLDQENLREYQHAAILATCRYDMVKMVGDVMVGFPVWIEICARHTDVLSFRNNLKYYLDQLVQARLFIEGRSIPRHY